MHFRYSPFKVLVLLFTFCIVVTICFVNLDELAIRKLDEGRNAVNAIEMYLSGQYLYTTFENEVDLWNTKPPLLIWMQVAAMHVVGPGILAVRLPGAVLGLGIAIILFLFSMKVARSFWIGITAILVLFSVRGFTGIHALETGDFDVPLTFFTLTGILIFYKFAVSGKDKFIFLAALLLSMAFLVKGIAAFLFLPGLFLYVIVTGNAKWILKNKAFWIAVFVPVIVFSGYYLMRNIVTPGYLGMVWDNEFLGRYAKVNENNAGAADFYLLVLLGPNFGIIPLILAVSAIPLSYRYKKHWDLTKFLSITVFIFFIVLSVSKTKLYWYAIPAYPLLAILVGITIHILVGLVPIDKIRQISYPLVLLFVFGVGIYKTVSRRIDVVDPNPEVYAFANVLKDPKLSAGIRDGYTFLDLQSYRPDYLFYSGVYGYKISFDNYNERSRSDEGKFAVWVPSIKGNIEEKMVVMTKEDIPPVTYYQNRPLDSLKVEGVLQHYDFPNALALGVGVTLVPHIKYPNRLLAMREHKQEREEYSFRFLCSYEFEYFKGHEGFDLRIWDFENHNGKDYKFVQLEGKPVSLDYGLRPDVNISVELPRVFRKY